MNKEVVIPSAARSAIGAFGGALSDMAPADLAAQVMRAAIARSGIDPHAILGAVPASLSRRRPLMSCSVPVGAMRWSRCASAAARASR